MYDKLNFDITDMATDDKLVEIDSSTL